MKTRFFIFAALAATTIFTGCNSRGTVAEVISDDGLLLNDDLIAVRTDDGKVSIKNATTGKVTIKDIKMGQGVYGMQIASKKYFGLTADELSAKESVCLAVCLPAPLKCSPFNLSGNGIRKRNQLIASFQK
ncbi:MAG: transglycosylase domain-containing protein [Bacteroidales bacterium]|nr:transglycosylase domain-containing protein [Bacteroidales bacterium]